MTTLAATAVAQPAVTVDATSSQRAPEARCAALVTALVPVAS